MDEGAKTPEQEPKTEATQEIHQMRHEHYLMRQKIHDQNVKIELLEALHKRALGMGASPKEGIHCVSLEQFLAMFGRGQSVFDKVRGVADPSEEVDAHQLQAMRMRERDKYEMIYDGRCPIRKYGATEHWYDLWPKIMQWKPESLCDIGTGLGGLPRTLYRETDIRHAAGVDFAMQQDVATEKVWKDPTGEEYALRLIRAPAHRIPFADKSFEWVTSFDMMEHLLPVEVDDVLKEMTRLARKGLMFSISYVPSYFKVNGTPLHICIRPRSWWIKTIRRVTGWNVRHYNKYIIATEGEPPEGLQTPLEYLYDLPAPETMIVLGKGPSLDQWVNERHNPKDTPVMAINEAMVKKPCNFGIYSDNQMVELSPPPNVSIIRPAFLEHNHGMNPQYVYDRAEYGSQTCSTASIAIHILGAWGVKRIIAVGFDAYDTPIGKVYADCVSNMISKRASSDFSFVNETIQEAIKATGIEMMFWHRYPPSSVGD